MTEPPSRSPTTPRSRAASRSRSGTRMRAGSIVGALAIAALLLARPGHGPVRDVEGRDPAPAAAVPDGPGPVAQPVPARGLQPDAARAQAHQGADRPELAQGIRLRHRLQPVHRASSSCASFGLDDSGAYSALLLLGAMAAAFTGGMFLKGKSGWCSTICPLLPVQRIYGQTPLMLVANAHCQPCVGCVKNCYDFNPRAAYLADLHDQDTYWSGYRKYFVGAFPGLVLGFFAVPRRADGAHHGGEPRRLRHAHHLLQDERPHDHEPVRRRRVRHLLLVRRRRRDRPAHLRAPRRRDRARRDLVRAHAQEGEAVPGEGRPGRGRRARPGRPGRPHPRLRPAQPSVPQVTFLPDNKRVAPKPGQSLLEIAEANDLPIEAGCRMGICGADPVAIKDGMSCTSRRSPTTRRPRSSASATPTTPGWRAA